jgi:uncharacterized membrane protein
MTDVAWSLSEDMPLFGAVFVGILVALTLVLLALELRRRERGGMLIFLTGALSAALLALAVLRPVEVATRGTVIGARVVVLVDQSRRLLLPDGDATRRQRATEALERLREHFAGARLEVLGFGEGAPVPVGPDGFTVEGRPSASSDLARALEDVATAPGERPQAVVVLSDGRFSRPGPQVAREALAGATGVRGVVVHGAQVATRALRDASVRSIETAGAAVAHQPLSITVEVGCTEGLECDAVPVVVRELRQGAAPAELAQGVARVEGDSGKVDLEIVLERAGDRVVEVAIEAPRGDAVPANDRRYVTFSVTRDRVRLLHLAGRPTYDVRALRTWLKSDESVDVVAFFILRTQSDDPEATEPELALIEFPVMELFTTHLPSFDAIVLQDIDAIEYKLAQYLPAVARYVEGGGGLIMVGGPSSFAGGNYAGTPLDWVFPVEPAMGREAYDTVEIVPRYTEAGRAAPVTRAIRDFLGDDLPTMVGANRLGPARPGALVLWEHPTERAGEHAMPLLALGEAGDGRTIALALDGTHRLAFSEFAARVAGRAYGALWDGLLGWLMRDPRYEGARVELDGECIAGEPATLRVTRLPGMIGEIEAVVERLGDPARPRAMVEVQAARGDTIDVVVPAPEPGGYAARVQVGAAPPTRHDFSCESGGRAWADVRPDPERLERIAVASGGRAVTASAVGELPLPEATEVTSERRVSPVAPPWAWTLAAATVLGAHWLARRRGGLA